MYSILIDMKIIKFKYFKDIKRLFILISTISLSSMLYAQPQIPEINQGWKFKQARLSNWYPATVPGVVHTDLLKNGIIEDPFYRLNERGLQWIDKEDWIYETKFNIHSDLFKLQHILLDCKGLDTYADVYLNDSLIVKADNMFREWKANVRNIIHEGKNTLRIYFHSPIKMDISKWDALPFQYAARLDQSENGGTFDKKVSIFARKAGYQYGWDWGPRLVTSGIWRPIQLIGWSDAFIDSQYFKQPKVDKSMAYLVDQVKIVADHDIKNATLQVRDLDSKIVMAVRELNIKKGESTTNIPFSIHHPQLWWTNGLGNPHRYNFETTLIVGNKKLDVKMEKIGVRSLKLVTKKDQYGTAFYFELNGHPLFCKGADYVPQDNFLPRVTDADYQKTILAVANSNMNMLRVWGGGIYENDIFYNLCDEYGVLVWQDFMFACSLYPAEGSFLENIKQEAIDNVCRLRNHACIALWCGNNENQEGWYTWGWKDQLEKKGKTIAEKVWNQFKNQYYVALPQVIKEYAPETAYWPSSPFSDYGQASNDHQGDYHYWGVWHGKAPIETYNTFRARFFSEYGFQSFPEFISIKQYAPKAEDWDIRSEVMMSHQRGGNFANELIESYLLDEYRKPNNFQRFLYMNQVLQGDAIKTAIEAHRRDRPYCMGTLFWQIDDCWPVASWASRDYYGRWKAQQYFSRKAYQDILVSPIMKDKNLFVYVVSDKLKSFKANLILKVMTFDGKVIAQKKSNIIVPANASTMIMKENITTMLGMIARNNVFVHASIVDEKGKLYDNNYVLLKQKEMSYPKVKVCWQIAPIKEGYKITLSASCFARAVFMQVDDVKSFFSDNYFDLLPNEKRTITLHTSLPKDDLLKSFSIKTLSD
jgi:beta-mannosidase